MTPLLFASAALVVSISGLVWLLVDLWRNP